MDWFKQKRVLLGLCSALLIIALLGFRLCAHAQSNALEIALTIGEPWEDMRKRSSAEISPAIPDSSWFRTPLSPDSRLRFIDPQYGFTTPPARFFTISFDDEKVNGVRMSPQVEPLLLDDALKVVFNLQDQWRKGGWRPALTDVDPEIVDTKEWRDGLKKCKSSTVFWRADEKFQTQVNLNCFDDPKHPKETRYLITLELSKPYLE